MPHSHRSVTLSPQPQLQEIFTDLMNTWRRETWFISSIKKRVSHPAYVKIIGLGPAAIPFIIAELRKQPDYWFWALEAITRQDPMPHAENMHQLKDAWLAWAESHGY
jgi:hypothetical protein